MPIRDKSIGWKEGRLWIPIKEFLGLDNNGTSDVSLSQGAPAIVAVTTSEITGLPMDAADEVAHVFPIPRDLDRNEPVLARIFFQHAAAGADTPQFTWTSKFYGKTEAMAEFIGTPDKSTAFPAHTCSTTNPSLEVTNWCDLSWEDYITVTDILAAISIELNGLGSAAADECKVLGVELAYEIKATQTHRQRSRHVVADQPV